MKLGVISDLHFSVNETAQGSWHNEFDFAGVARRVAQALAFFEDEAVDAVLVLGDVTHFGDRPSLAAALGMFGPAGRPVFVLAGNHDIPAGDGFLTSSPRPPHVELLDWAGRTVGGIDLVGATITGSADAAGMRLADESIERRQWDSSFIVLASHFPVLSRARAFAARRIRYAEDLTGVEALAVAVRERFAPTLVLNGHLHARDAHAQARVLQLSAAAVIEPPSEASILEIRPGVDGSIVVQRMARSLTDCPVPKARNPVLCPAIDSWTFAGGRWRPELYTDVLSEHWL